MRQKTENRKQVDRKQSKKGVKILALRPSLLAEHEQRGFTLLELTIAMTMISILSLIISEFYSQRLVDYARNFTLTILQSNTKQAIESVAGDLRAARTIESNNSLPDPHGPGGNQYGWASTSGSAATLVLGVPAQDGSGNLLWVDPSTHSTPYLNDIVYYLDSSSKILYRRTIANSAATGNAATTTCPLAAATPTCPADGKVIEDVANMTLSYFDGSNNSITTPSASYSANISLQQTRTSFGRTYSNILTSRVTLRNKP